MGKGIKSLKDLEVEPSGQVWKKIEENLPAERKRRWLFWIFPAMLVVSGLWLYFNGMPSRSVWNNSATDLKKDVSVKESEEKEISSTALVIHTNENKITAAEKSNSIPSSNRTEKNIFSKGKTNNSQNGIINSNHNSSKPINNQTEIHDQGIKDQNIFERGNELAFIEKLFVLERIPVPAQGSTEVKTKTEEAVNNKQLSRWSVFAGASYLYSSPMISKNTNDEVGVTVKGHYGVGFNAGLSYDASTHVKISFGINHFISGDDRRGTIPVILNGPPGDPNNTYSLVTSYGNINVSESTFNSAYFDSQDSVLFPPSAFLTPGGVNSKSVPIYVKQEFELLEIPIEISYRPFHRRITPFAGLSFSTIYLLKKRVYLENKDIQYKYQNAVANQVFTLGISTGAELALSKRTDFFLGGFYRKGMNAIIDSDNAKKPVYVGINAGISFRFSRIVRD